MVDLRKLKAARAYSGKKQSDVATECGISQTMYSMYESGRIKFPIDLVPKVAKSLGLSNEQILEIFCVVVLPK